LDGNGRIGRLLIPLYLASHGLLAKPSLYLSDFFERNRASYYDALMQVWVSNDLIHWVRFFLSGVASATKEREVFRQILVLRSELGQTAVGIGKRATTARQALNFLYRRSVIEASDLERALEVTTPTANTLIRTLMEKEILEEITGQQRGRVYAFNRYLKLFLS